MFKILFIAISLIFFSSCQEQTRHDQSPQKVQTFQKEIFIPTNVDENFDLFLKTFSKDSIFQVSRVKFPLKAREWVDPEIGTIEKSISKQEYSVLDFTYPEDATTRELDRYTQEIKMHGLKCVVEIRGIDNGIYTDFFFEKVNGKWTLISWMKNQHNPDSPRLSKAYLRLSDSPVEFASLRSQ